MRVKLIIAIVVVGSLLLFFIVAAIGNTIPSNTVNTDEMEKDSETINPDKIVKYSETTDPDIIKIEITDCYPDSVASYLIVIESTFKNLDMSRERTVHYKYYITDNNDNILNYDTSWQTLGPEQIKYPYIAIEYKGDWTSCGIEITDIRY